MATAPPSHGEDYRRWLEQTDAIRFIRGNIESNRVVIHASLPHVYIHGVFAPTQLVDPPDVGSLLQWHLSPFDIARTEISHAGQIAEHSAPSTTHSRESTFTNSVLIRHFPESIECDSNVEIFQPLLLESNLFFMHERKAWCRIDQHGDIEEAIKIIEVATDGPASVEGRIVIASKDVLERWSSVSDSKLLVFFDFSRFNPKMAVSWEDQLDEQRVTNDSSVYYRFSIMPEFRSQSRGFQIAKLRREHKGSNRSSLESQGQYVEFIAWDWKNQRLAEISCAPNCIVNYFTDSKLPYEMTPAFFRPEVLLRFKNDMEKYVFEERSISSRAGWVLEHYDINSAGQVHVYLNQLGKLPHCEQLYWKSYNEKPKAGLSERAIRQDFAGDWEVALTPLASLKETLRALKCDWWKPASESVFTRSHYPVTQSKDEWCKDILALHQMIVEGFQEKWLRNKAKSLGQSPSPMCRSIALIRECLLGLSVPKDRADDVVSAFAELHKVRSIVSAHSAEEKARQRAKYAIEEFSSYRDHFDSLVTKCHDALHELTTVLGLTSEPDTT